MWSELDCPDWLARPMPRLSLRLAILVVLAVPSVSLSSRSASGGRTADAPTDSYAVVNVYPHDSGAYTQGLIFRDGFLYESTGLNGHSSVRQVKLETGEVMQQRPVNAAYFAEGLTEWRGELFQLTWRSQIAFVYDVVTLAPRRTLSYSGEGWGLTHDGTALILSDGTATLRFMDPSTFNERRRVIVTDRSVPVTDINELEFVEGEIYANVWHTNRIGRISPSTGRVNRWIDLTGLMSSPFRLDAEAVLNGIAYDPASKRLFVTGKLWPRLFEIRVVARKTH
jgi:glutamine cyclotransferase